MKGDGTPDLVDGMCEKEDPTRKCLSTGECRLCKFVTMDLDNIAVDRYEGCGGATSTEPICDADSGTTTFIEFQTADYIPTDDIPKCVKCKKRGKYAIYNMRVPSGQFPL